MHRRRAIVKASRSTLSDPSYSPAILDSVRLGGVELSSIEAVVIEQGLDIALLGMSFLNRVEMKRDGQMMTLMRRF